MTDKQKLVYDLAMRCAALQVQRDNRTDTPLQAQMINAFTSFVKGYQAMDASTLLNALAELKNV